MDPAGGARGGREVRRPERALPSYLPPSRVPRVKPLISPFKETSRVFARLLPSNSALAGQPHPLQSVWTQVVQAALRA